MSDAHLTTQRQIQALQDQIERLRKADAGGLPSGTSFPSSPTTNYLFYRTDLGWVCYYDGTRWLTLHEYETNLTQFFINPLPFTGAGPSTILLAPTRTDYRYWYTHSDYYIFVNTTNDGSNYWAITFTDSGATNFWTPNTSAAGVGQSTGDNAQAVAGSNGAVYMNVQLTKVGSPGSVSAFHFTAYHRLIVT